MGCRRRGLTPRVSCLTLSTLQICSIDSRASAMSSVSSESQAAQSSKRRNGRNTDTHPFIGLKFHSLPRSASPWYLYIPAHRAHNFILTQTYGCSLNWRRRHVEMDLVGSTPRSRCTSQRVIDSANLGLVEIRTDYLLDIKGTPDVITGGSLQALAPTRSAANHSRRIRERRRYIRVAGARGKGNLTELGLREDIPVSTPFLQRRLHLWFEIRPPEINVSDPWSDQQSFDPYTFTLPTLEGPVAPARWKTQFWRTKAPKFEGKVCDFMHPVYFRQEVLTKYECASGFDVEDNGSVSCRHYWVLSAVRGGLAMSWSAPRSGTLRKVFHSKSGHTGRCTPLSRRARDRKVARKRADRARCSKFPCTST